MSESFSTGIKKHNSTTIGQVEGHNDRLHKTESQLPEAAWFSPEGVHVIVPFRKDLIKQANGLKKRKDAVIAVQLVVQVGNQTDWRELPTAEFPHGKRKPGTSKRLNDLINGAKEAAFQEFGEERIVSIALHTDESTPHVHIVFVPIFEEKLQAKHWLNGKASCAALLKRMHGHVSQFIDCTYTPGAPGGAPHDPSKRAGGVNAPKPAPTLVEKAKDKLSGAGVIKQLKAKLAELSQELQTIFSKLKSAEKRANEEGDRATKEVELREKAIKKAQEMHALNQVQKAEIDALKIEVTVLQAEVEVLKPKPPPPVEPVRSPAHAFLKTLDPVDPVPKEKKKVDSSKSEL